MEKGELFGETGPESSDHLGGKRNFRDKEDHSLILGKGMRD